MQAEFITQNVSEITLQQLLQQNNK
jgi:hypothetical protein